MSYSHLSGRQASSNLQRLMLIWLRFRVDARRPIEIRAGALIDYRRRIRGWPVKWRTEFSEWHPPHRFVDSQRRGPCRLWLHQHTFTAEDDGTRVDDHVAYRVLGGRVVHNVFVRRAQRRIFDLRQKSIEILLGTDPEETQLKTG